MGRARLRKEEKIRRTRRSDNKERYKTDGTTRDQKAQADQTLAFCFFENATSCLTASPNEREGHFFEPSRLFENYHFFVLLCPLRIELRNQDKKKKIAVYIVRTIKEYNKGK